MIGALDPVVLAASLAASGGDLPSITDTSVAWPGLDEVLNVLLLRDYNTRLVVLSTAVLGAAAGLIGTFLLLRKRSLMGDALSHATLPGIALAFMVMVALGGDGRYLPGLLLGATVFGLLGVGGVLLIKGATRLKDDVALGIVLSVFFGLGVALLGIVQEMPEGSAAGLQSFIYGKTASMIRSDLLLISSAAAAVAVLSGLLYKEFTLLCFDEQFAGAQGWPVTALDIAMMLLVTAVTVIGLQAVGLILIIALLIIPPAAARFWTDHLKHLLLVSAAIGGVSGWLGASLSALVPRLPAGAIIVVVAAAGFLLSMILGSSRGVVRRLLMQWRVARTVARQHLLRALFEAHEGRAPDRSGIGTDDLMARRSWTRWRLGRLLAWGRRRGLLRASAAGAFELTDSGLREAARIARNHRLWEHYLITYADIAPTHVDRDADQIEHVLGERLVAALEASLDAELTDRDVPPSPHELGARHEGTEARRHGGNRPSD